MQPLLAKSFIRHYVESQTRLITGATVVVSTISVNAENLNDLIVTVRFSNSTKDLFGCCSRGKFGVNAFQGERWVMWYKFETLTEAQQCSEILKRRNDFVVYVWDLTSRPNKIRVENYVPHSQSIPSVLNDSVGTFKIDVDLLDEIFETKRILF